MLHQLPLQHSNSKHYCLLIIIVDSNFCFIFFADIDMIVLVVVVVANNDSFLVMDFNENFPSLFTQI